MKKIVALMLVCALSLGTLAAPSTASAKDRLTLSEARDLVQLGRQAAGGLKKVRNGVQTFNDKVSAVQKIGKSLRRR